LATLLEKTAHLAQFKSGNEKILGFFVGQAMKATQGKANPKLLNELLRSKLGQ
jgi:aspartyl-tRNA(Asn)/glutamyl-tRNA(Gln) amidotransferase subunit B